MASMMETWAYAKACLQVLWTIARATISAR
jgi:hypothetical protein